MVQLQSPERGVNLGLDRRFQVVNFVDNEKTIAASSDRFTDDLFGITVFVIRGCIDEIQPRIDRAAECRDTDLEGKVSVGQVANAQNAGFESSPTQLAPRLKNRKGSG